MTPTAELISITRARNKVWTIRVRCPYCKRTHTHGGGNRDDHIDLGPRLSHCGANDYLLGKKQP